MIRACSRPQGIRNRVILVVGEIVVPANILLYPRRVQDMVAPTAQISIQFQLTCPMPVLFVHDFDAMDGRRSARQLVYSQLPCRKCTYGPQQRRQRLSIHQLHPPCVPSHLHLRSCILWAHEVGIFRRRSLWRVPAHDSGIDSVFSFESIPSNVPEARRSMLLGSIADVKRRG